MKNRPTHKFHQFLRTYRLYTAGAVKGTYILDQAIALWNQRIFKYFRTLQPQAQLVNLPTLSSYELYAKQLRTINSSKDVYRWQHYMLKATSQAVLYGSDYYRHRVSSYKKLPCVLYTQNRVYRAETRTTPLIRHNQIYFFTETHHAYGTAQAAMTAMTVAIARYRQFLNYLAIPYFVMDRPAEDRFGGSIRTIAFDTVIHGKRLQLATIHNLGTNFAAAFNLVHVTTNNSRQYVHQLSDGWSERIIMALLYYHYDQASDCLRLPERLRLTYAVYLPGAHRQSAIDRSADRIIVGLPEQTCLQLIKRYTILGHRLHVVRTTIPDSAISVDYPRVAAIDDLTSDGATRQWGIDIDTGSPRSGPSY